MKNDFEKIYKESIKKPEEFWQKISEDIFWFKKPTQILKKDKPPFYKWFSDGVTNTCYNALDLHIDEGKGDDISSWDYWSNPSTHKEDYNWGKMALTIFIIGGILMFLGIVE